MGSVEIEGIRIHLDFDDVESTHSGGDPDRPFGANKCTTSLATWEDGVNASLLEVANGSQEPVKIRDVVDWVHLQNAFDESVVIQGVEALGLELTSSDAKDLGLGAVSGFDGRMLSRINFAISNVGLDWGEGTSGSRVDDEELEIGVGRSSGVKGEHQGVHLKLRKASHLEWALVRNNVVQLIHGRNVDGSWDPGEECSVTADKNHVVVKIGRSSDLLDELQRRGIVIRRGIEGNHGEFAKGVLRIRWRRGFSWAALSQSRGSLCFRRSL
jgi:hypothetical protein